jgi:quercetin dioxygenase-like cupin family protein
VIIMGLSNRVKLLAAGAAVAALGAAGIVSASHVTEVNPAAVPGGFLAAHNVVAEMPLSPFARAAAANGADVFIQHAHLDANVATSWHTHPGMAIVTVVDGSLTYQDAKSGACRNREYGQGHGFVDPGFGHVHRAIAGPSGAHFYVVYVLPPGSTTHVIPALAPEECTS